MIILMIIILLITIMIIIVDDDDNNTNNGNNKHDNTKMAPIQGSVKGAFAQEPEFAVSEDRNITNIAVNSLICC